MRMDGAELTMSGRAATNPAISGGKGERVSFRAVSTERRFDEASGDWVDGDEFGVTVVCWRQLGSSVLQLLRKGDPVVVVGRISTRKFERDGVVDYFTEVKADHVAFDVARSVGRVKREDVLRGAEGQASKPIQDAQGDTAAPTDDGAVDPFQPAADADSLRELVEVI
jgi:single-strand DNA-binding protein